ncbi:TetR/AcrR family transcriptional regulator [Streptomyces sp. NBC_01619]|uniref:TetR/AcrR family transcriptional regulator n=1 Tax=unclassified Streptomyces TaxID=2593676 RepID=UPI00224F069D|nr:MULTISPECIES: TetR/AcrR family transcriptional regulator [unclassified Streptomyces]MCX4512249.1 TetR/AcrR family transcriptional regulator [Streptomyces sp. NBC_01619]
MSTEPTARVSHPRQRLLETAAELFYAEGIQAVGVDRLIATAAVTKATFYRHFRGKDELVLAYLRVRDEEIRARTAQAAAAAKEPRTVVELLVGGLAEEVCGPGFRGCPFINAAAEYPDAEHPVRRLIAEHRAWFRGALADLAAACGHPAPDEAAAALVLLRDGALAGGYLDGGDTVRTHLSATAQALLRLN